MMEWWRSWHGAPTDNKWLLIGNKAGVPPGMVSAIFWALLDCASQAAERGCVASFDVETYAAFSGFEESDIQAVLDAMRDKKLIGKDNRLTTWDKRQPKREDDSRERVRAYRERKRNEPVTSLPEPHHNVTQRNAVKQEVTLDTDTDKETDKRREEKGGKHRPPDPTLKDPAVIAYRDRTHVTPDPEWRKRIVETVDDVPRWDGIVVDWLGSGWNKRNVKGMLKVYRDGWSSRNNGAGPKLDPKLEALRMLEEEDPSG